MDIELLFAFILIIFAIYMIIIGINEVITNQKCLELGWRDGEITWNFQAYCIREENEYEITKPLKELLK